MTGSDFRQVALSGARWTLAAKISLQLFTWPVTIVVIRLLEPGDYGLLAMAMVIIGFVSLFRWDWASRSCRPTSWTMQPPAPRVPPSWRATC
jgi:hypothetical protein